MKLLFCTPAWIHSALTGSLVTITIKYCYGAERNVLFACFGNGANNELQPFAAADGYAAR